MDAEERHATAAGDPAPAGGGPWDAVVVGAGPAGATAARQLARQGHRVMLLDSRAFPREKVCGHALLADALACLERVGLLDEVAARA